MVASTQSQARAFLPSALPSYQPVSSALATACWRTNSRASSTGTARASLVCCSILEIAPSDTSTLSTEESSSWASRFDCRNRTVKSATIDASTGPNAPRGTPTGNSARVMAPQSAQTSAWS